MLHGKPVNGKTVYCSPEFKAFCERFGIIWNAPTTELTIKLTIQEMTVTHSYRPREYTDEELKNLVCDTTSMHNKEYATAIPVIIEENKDSK